MLSNCVPLPAATSDTARANDSSALCRSCSSRLAAEPAAADNVLQFNLGLAEQTPARRKAAGGANGRR